MRECPIPVPKRFSSAFQCTRLHVFVRLSNTRFFWLLFSASTTPRSFSLSLSFLFHATTPQAINPTTRRVWQSLEKALHQYHHELEERSNLVQNVSSLHTQNQELKALLNQYMGSKVNEELIVPPTQVIRVDE